MEIERIYKNEILDFWLAMWVNLSHFNKKKNYYWALLTPYPYHLLLPWKSCPRLEGSNPGEWVKALNAVRGVLKFRNRPKRQMAAMLKDILAQTLLDWLFQDKSLDMMSWIVNCCTNDRHWAPMVTSSVIGWQLLREGDIYITALPGIEMERVNDRPLVHGL